MASLQIWAQSCGRVLNGRTREIRSLGDVSPHEMRKGSFAHGEKGVDTRIGNSPSLEFFRLQTTYNILWSSTRTVPHSTSPLVTGLGISIQAQKPGKWIRLGAIDEASTTVTASSGVSSHRSPDPRSWTLIDGLLACLHNRHVHQSDT